MLSPTILLFGGLYIAFILTRWIINFTHHHQQSKALNCKPPRPGSSGFLGLPAFFRLTKAVREKRWIDYLSDEYAVHGTTYQQTFLSKYLITTIEPENIKAILATQFKDFCLGTRHQQFYPLMGDGIFTLDGAGWSHARGLLRPQFTRDQVADLSMLDDHISHLVDLIPKDRTSFDIQRLFFLLTLDSATHFLFGESVGCMLPPSQTTGVLEKSAVGSAQGFADAFGLAQDYLASRSRAQGLYWLVNPKEFQEANAKVHEVVDHYVNLALESKRNPEKGDGRYIFLQALAADTDDPKMLRDNMLNILLAGRDTTASLLSSTFFYLSRHQNVWNRLRREIVELFGDAKNPRAEMSQAKLKDIPYLRYVLNEGMCTFNEFVGFD
jgi:cytochrome P450